MSFRVFVVRACCGLSLLLIAGCYGPGMHSPYGGFRRGLPYGQPYMLPQGGQPYPGSLTVPGGVVVPPNSSVPYTPGASGDDDWQPFSQSGDGLGDDGFGSGSGDSSGYGTDNAGGVPRPDMFDEDETQPFGALGDSSTDVQASAFRQPEVSGSNAAMFGYEQKDYSWLRGIIGRNEADGTYDIVYALRPRDEYEGNFVFVPDQRLRNFRRGDIVLVTGKIDTRAHGPLGKPRYRIATIEKITAGEN